MGVIKILQLKVNALFDLMAKFIVKPTFRLGWGDFQIKAIIADTWGLRGVVVLPSSSWTVCSCMLLARARLGPKKVKR